jgi:hypothetical protein
VPPVADVEGRVGQDEVGAQVGVLVAGEGVGGLAAQVEVDAADGQVHRRQAPGGGVGFLPVDGHVAQLAAVGLDELFGLHEHAAGAAAGVVHLAVVGASTATRVLTMLAGCRTGRPSCPRRWRTGRGSIRTPGRARRGRRRVVAKADGGDQIHQLAELAVGQLGAAVALVEDALELGVLLLDHRQRFVDALADVGLLGGGAELLPSGRPRAPRRR